MVGRPHTHPNARTGHRTREDMLVIDGGPTADGFTVPDIPPEGAEWSAAAVAAWRLIWSDALVQRWGIGPSQILVTQYVSLYEEWLSCMRSFRRRRFVFGSTGQPKANPMGAEARAIRADMDELERKLWLDPQSALNAGIERVAGWLTDEGEVRKGHIAETAEWEVPDGYVVEVEPLALPSGEDDDGGLSAGE